MMTKLFACLVLLAACEPRQQQQKKPAEDPLGVRKLHFPLTCVYWRMPSGEIVNLEATDVEIDPYYVQFGDHVIARENLVEIGFSKSCRPRY